MRAAVSMLGASCVATTAAALFAQIPPVEPASTSPMAAACTAFINRDNGAAFAKIPDAPTAINSARIIPAGGTHGVADDDLPEICRVEGNINPTVGFLLRMPTTGWNGKFMMGGCGGPCGNYLEDRIDQALVRKYAVVNTDMGHKGSGLLYGYNNPQGQIDFAYRATHLTAKVAKQLIATFYGTVAKHNYFLGCSTGGRQAMISAQRFPKDFDGIIAGAPPFDHIGDTPYFLEWNARANTAADGGTILTRPAAELVRAGVLKKCDALDGLKDGLVLDPAACRFDPKTLICKPGQDAAQCLSPAQADVAQKFRDGARNSKGEKLYWGMPWGSEDQWTDYDRWISRTGKQYNGSGYSLTGYLGYASGPPGGPTFRPSDFNYDTDPQRTDLTGIIYNPVNPDLSRFRDAGGKLILFHGWNDSSIPVEASIDYYVKAERANGGRAATEKFLRFYTPPMFNHCRYGAGGGEIDWITALEDWVERDRPPEALIAYRPVAPYPSATRSIEDYGIFYSKFGRHPLPPGYYDTARPVYRWPAVAHYSGKGDPAKATSWREVMR